MLKSSKENNDITQKQSNETNVSLFSNCSMLARIIDKMNLLLNARINEWKNEVSEKHMSWWLREPTI